MSIAEFGALGEGIGSLLILVTLVYLAVQNRQQQRLLLSQAYQSRTDTSVSFIIECATHPELVRAAYKPDRNEIEQTQAIEYWRVFTHMWENLFFRIN